MDNLPNIKVLPWRDSRVQHSIYGDDSDIAIGDSLSALHGVIGILLALRHRDQNGGEGQMIDVALYASIFNMMESLLPEYSVFGAVREPAGSSLPGIAPSNAYLCADGKYALIAGNGDGIFRRLMDVIGRADLRDDAGLFRNDGRVHQSAASMRPSPHRCAAQPGRGAVIAQCRPHPGWQNLRYRRHRS